MAPVMDMFLMEVRDKQVRRPILYIDYMVMSPPSGTLRGDGSEALVDTVLRPPNEEEVGQMGVRVEAMALGPINVPPVSAAQMQPKRAASPGYGEGPLRASLKAKALRKLFRSLGFRRPENFKCSPSKLINWRRSQLINWTLWLGDSA